jgi:hypothetical protein
MPDCNEPRDPFNGSMRPIEGGRLGVYKQDFNAHISGTAFNHCADQINMSPPLEGCGAGLTVQEAIENLISCSGGGLFVSIGNITEDGYVSGDYNVGAEGIDTLEQAFAAAFMDPHLENGGVIVIKSGTYSLSSTVTVPPGITLWGEPGGTIINGRMTEAPMFVIGTAKPRVNLGYENTSLIRSQNNPQFTKFWNITLIDNLNREGGFSLINTPMIAVQDGAYFIMEQSTCLGATLASVSDSSLVAVGRNTSISTTNPTTVEVINSYIDGFSGGILFGSTNGATDRLIVKNTRFRYLGNRSIVSAINTTICNMQVIDNTFLGTRDGLNFLSDSPVNILGTAVTNSVNCRMIVGNNGGGLVNNVGTNVDNSFFPIPVVRTPTTPVIRGLLSLNNTWSNSYTSASFFMTVGDGITSVGDLTGVNSLDIILQRAHIFPEYNSVIYVGSGTYTITNNFTDSTASLIGMGVGTGPNAKPIIQLNFNEVENINLFGHRSMSLFKNVKNIQFRNIGANVDALSIRGDASGFTNVKDCSFSNVPLVVNNSNNCNISNCVFEQNGFVTNFISLYIDLSTTNQTFVESCSFLGHGYAFYATRQISGDADNNKKVSVNNCIFNPFGSGSGEKISNALSLLPWSGFRQRYMLVDLGRNGDFTIENSIVNAVDPVNNIFETTNQTLIDGYTHNMYIEFGARNTRIDNCVFDCPDQAMHISRNLVPSVYVVSRGSCIITDSSFRGNLPLAVIGNHQVDLLRQYFAPIIRINGCKINRYVRQKNRPASAGVYDAIEALYVNIATAWGLYTSTFSYPSLQVDISNNQISATKNSSDTEPTIYYTLGTLAGTTNSIYTLDRMGVCVYAPNYGVNFSDNNVTINTSRFGTLTPSGQSVRQAAVAIRVDRLQPFTNLPSWAGASSINNNKIHYIDFSTISEAERTLCFYSILSNTTICGNTFSWVKSSGQAFGGSISGWLQLSNNDDDDETNDVPNPTCVIISNNIFFRSGVMGGPQGIHLNRKVEGSGLFTNNVFNLDAGVFSTTREPKEGWKYEDHIINSPAIYTGESWTSWKETILRKIIHPDNS